MPRKPKKRTWGSGSIRASGDRWLAQWRENGRKRSKTFATRALAEEVLASIVRNIERGAAGMPRDSRDVPTLGEAVKPWLERRAKTHRSHMDDKSRWKQHLGPYFGYMKPGDVDAAKIRAFVEAKLASGLKPATVNRCMGVLSTFFEDLKEQKYVETNPMIGLPRSTRRLLRSDYDTRATPFLQTPGDVRRVFLALPEPYSVMFAVGALAGLRVGETLGLSWEDIDVPGRRLHIHRQMQDGRLCGLKDDEPRLVPLLTSLAPILAQLPLAWRGNPAISRARQGNPPMIPRGGPHRHRI